MSGRPLNAKRALKLGLASALMYAQHEPSLTQQNPRSSNSNEGVSSPKNSPKNSPNNWTDTNVLFPSQTRAVQYSTSPVSDLSYNSRDYSTNTVPIHFKPVPSLAHGNSQVSIRGAYKPHKTARLGSKALAVSSNSTDKTRKRAQPWLDSLAPAVVSSNSASEAVVSSNSTDNSLAAAGSTIESEIPSGNSPALTSLTSFEPELVSLNASTDNSNSTDNSLAPAGSTIESEILSGNSPALTSLTPVKPELVSLNASTNNSDAQPEVAADSNGLKVVLPASADLPFTKKFDGQLSPLAEVLPAPTQRPTKYPLPNYLDYKKVFSNKDFNKFDQVLSDEVTKANQLYKDLLNASKTDDDKKNAFKAYHIEVDKIKEKVDVLISINENAIKECSEQKRRNAEILEQLKADHEKEIETLRKESVSLNVAELKIPRASTAHLEHLFTYMLLLKAADKETTHQKETQLRATYQVKKTVFFT